jgi:hypothetical protein
MTPWQDLGVSRIVQKSLSIAFLDTRSLRLKAKIYDTLPEKLYGSVLRTNSGLILLAPFLYHT